VSDAGAGGRPRIVLTNDDGWGSAGLVALAAEIARFAEVTVVAPRREQSGVGHAITLRGEIRVDDGTMSGVAAAYVVDGTPADCAKVAIRSGLVGGRIDLLVSGVNNGPNVGVNVLYSGTVGAALEAAINGVPAIAVSKEFGPAMGFADAARAVAPIVRTVAGRGLPAWRILNVNVPCRSPAELAGVKLTRHGVSGFDESYRELPRAPGTRRFVLEGAMKLRDDDCSTDAEALRDGFVSVTPLGLDLTARPVACADDAAWAWVLGR
jgi:5'-nucleotidase